MRWFLALLGLSTAQAQLSIDTSNPGDWKIANGALSLDWSSTGGNVWGAVLAGRPDNLVDVTNLNGSGHPKGFYMDNAGVGSGTTTAGYDLQPGRYLDWWITTASNAANAFTYTEHFLVFPNDPGIHAYTVFQHGAADIPGSLGQVQYVFRLNLALFPNTFSDNSGLNNLGVTTIPLPSASQNFSTDPGRTVQDATVDLHGFALPPGFSRQFYTKYDYSSYEYLHQLHGVYGDTSGAWMVLPSHESMVGGPVKQNLIFTGNLLIGELLSDHYAYNLGYIPPQGQSSSRLFGPVYVRFNTGAVATMFQDAQASASGFFPLYDSDATLVAAGYVPSSGRGSAALSLAGEATGTNQSWAVLADNRAYFAFSAAGAQYWANNTTGSVALDRLIPGTYRLSTYTLGQWGETRVNGVAVAAGQTTTLSTAFVSENFGTAPPLWTIGSPTRSADKFLHGTDASGQDDREYWGAWNYWSDFAANNGAVVYYATAVGATPATNDLSQINYIQWRSFNPNLYGGIFNAADDTTDGYKYLVPSYVKNPASSTVPPWQIYFATSAAQQQQGPDVVLSIGLAATNSNLTAILNGHALTWPGYSTLKTSDPQVRSGVAGTYQWVVFQWPISALTAPGQSNQLTLSVDHSQGVMYDAFRMEIADTADPGLRGWNDYEFVTAGVYIAANDSLPNPTAPRTDRLINLSARASVDPAHPLTVGFVLGGAAPKQLVLRGIGPALAPFGIPSPLPQPLLTLYDKQSTPLQANAGWGGTAPLASAFAQVGAFALPAPSPDAGMLATLTPGNYTIILSDPNADAGGVGLAEVYDASVDPEGRSQKLLNVSALGQASGGTGALVAGFVISGNLPKSVLVRGIGPALSSFGVPGVLADPALTLFDSGGRVVAQNDNWGAQASGTSAAVATAATTTGAFGLPAGSKDAALIAVLPPGAYSAQVNGPSGSSGLALVEVYEIPE